MKHPSIKFISRWTSSEKVYYIELFKHSTQGYFVLTNTLNTRYRPIGHRSLKFALDVVEKIQLEFFCYLAEETETTIIYKVTN